MSSMADKSKKKKDTTLNDILLSTENVNQIGVEQARSLSKAESYEKSVESIWGVNSSEKTAISKNAHSETQVSEADKSSMEQTSIEQKSSMEEKSIELSSIEQTSIEESSMEEQTSIEQKSIDEQTSIEQKSIDDPSKLTLDWQIALYTIRNFSAFIRAQTVLNANEKIVLEHIFDRALLFGSHVVTMTNSDIQSNLNISYKWAGKTLQSLEEKNWIDHKQSLSKTNKSKVSIEKAISNFVVAKSLSIQIKSLLGHLFNHLSMEQKSIDPYMLVMLVSKNIYILTNEQNLEQSMEESSIDQNPGKEMLLYFSAYSSLKQILLFASLKSFDIQQISKKFLFDLTDMFSDKVYGDRIPIRAQNVEKEVVQAIFYAAPRARKNKWGYLEKTLKDNYSSDMTMDQHDKCVEELEICNQLCEKPEKALLFGVDEIIEVLKAFPILTKLKEVNEKNVEVVRKDIKDFFVFSPKAVEEFLSKNGFKSRKPSDDLRA